MKSIGNVNKTHNLIYFLFLFACFAFQSQPVLGDEAIAEDPQWVQIGDLVTVRFSVQLEDGRLVRTNQAALAKSRQAKIPLFAILQGTENFSPREIIAGSPEALPGAPLLGSHITGMRAGEKKTLTLTPEQAYGPKNPDLIKTFRCLQKESRIVHMGPKEFFDNFNAFPVVGKTVNLLPYFKSKIIRVREQAVTLQALVRDGARLIGAYGTATVRFEKEAMTLTVSPVAGAPFILRDLTGTILYADAGEFSVDFNPLPVGEKIVLEVEVLSLIKASTLNHLQLPWIEDYAQGLASGKENQKPMVLVLYSPECHFCEQLLTESLTDPRIKVLGDQFNWVKVDSGKETALYEYYQQDGYPLTVILDKNGQEIGRIEGYKPAGEIRAELGRALMKNVRSNES